MREAAGAAGASCIVGGSYRGVRPMKQGLFACAIVVLGGCFDLSSSSSPICGLPSEEPPSEPPVDACRDGTIVFGPERIGRERGNPVVDTHEFDTAGEAHACVTIVSAGIDRQRVASGSIELDGERIAGPNL